MSEEGIEISADDERSLWVRLGLLPAAAYSQSPLPSGGAGGAPSSSAYSSLLHPEFHRATRDIVDAQRRLLVLSTRRSIAYLKARISFFFLVNGETERQMELEKTLSYYNLDALVAVPDHNVRTGLLNEYFTSLRVDSRDLPSILQQHVDEFQQHTVNRLTARKRKIQVLMLIAYAATKRLGEFLSAAALSLFSAYDKHMSAEIVKSASASGAMDPSDFRSILTRTLFLYSPPRALLTIIAPSRLSFSLQLDLPVGTTWCSCAATSGVIRSQLGTLPLELDALLHHYGAIMRAIDAESKAASFMQLVARLFDLVHPESMLLAEVSMFPTYGVNLLRRRLKALGYDVSDSYVCPLIQMPDPRPMPVALVDTTNDSTQKVIINDTSQKEDVSKRTPLPSIPKVTSHEVPSANNASAKEPDQNPTFAKQATTPTQASPPALSSSTTPLQNVKKHSEKHDNKMHRSNAADQVPVMLPSTATIPPVATTWISGLPIARLNFSNASSSSSSSGNNSKNNGREASTWANTICTCYLAANVAGQLVVSHWRKCVKYFSFSVPYGARWNVGLCCLTQNQRISERFFAGCDADSFGIRSDGCLVFARKSIHTVKLWRAIKKTTTTTATATSTDAATTATKKKGTPDSLNTTNQSDNNAPVANSKATYAIAINFATCQVFFISDGNVPETPVFGHQSPYFTEEEQEIQAIYISSRLLVPVFSLDGSPVSSARVKPEMTVNFSTPPAFTTTVVEGTPLNSIFNVHFRDSLSIMKSGMLPPWAYTVPYLSQHFGGTGIPQSTTPQAQTNASTARPISPAGPPNTNSAFSSPPQAQSSAQVTMSLTSPTNATAGQTGAAAGTSSTNSHFSFVEVPKEYAAAVAAANEDRRIFLGLETTHALGIGASAGGGGGSGVSSLLAATSSNNTAGGGGGGSSGTSSVGFPPSSNAFGETSWSRFPPREYVFAIAAISIQRAWRHHWGRKQRRMLMEQRQRAACTIQRAARKMLQLRSRRKNLAAKIIQRTWRVKRYLPLCMMALRYKKSIADLHRFAKVIQRRYREHNFNPNRQLAREYGVRVTTVLDSVAVIYKWWRRTLLRLHIIRELKSQNKAAARIQSTWRGHRLRKMLRPEIKERLNKVGRAMANTPCSLLVGWAVIRIQKRFREFLAKRVRLRMLHTRRDAVIKIQRAWRGYWVRSNIHIQFGYSETVFLRAVRRCLIQANFDLRLYRPCGLAPPHVQDPGLLAWLGKKPQGGGGGAGGAQTALQNIFSQQNTQGTGRRY